MLSLAARYIFRHGTQCYKINDSVLTSVVLPRTVRISTSRSYSQDLRDERSEMMEIWPDIVTELTEIDHRIIPETMQWLKKALEYLVPSEHMYRGSLVINSFRQLASADQLTDENLKLAKILAWAVELWEAAIVLQDDIMDQAMIRKGKIVWSLHSNFGLGAINDALILEQAIYQLLQQHFKKKRCYVDLVEIFHEITMLTALGQSIDLLRHIDGKLNFDLFTMDYYNACCHYKAIFSYGPIVITMNFLGMNDPNSKEQTMDMLRRIARFSQIQNDYLDVYGDVSVTKKTSNDIEMGKATWLATVALQIATPQQKQIFKECYGEKDTDKVAQIQELYDQLALREIYEIYQNRFYKDINIEIEQLSNRPLRNLLHKFVDKIYRQDYLF